MTVWVILVILFCLCVALIDIASIAASCFEEDRIHRYFDELDFGNDYYPVDVYDCYQTDDEQKEGD